MYVHSIPSNNDNPDVVSMGTNSAMITKRVIENVYEVLSILIISLIKSIHYLKVEKKYQHTLRKFMKISGKSSQFLFMIRYIIKTLVITKIILLITILI